MSPTPEALLGSLVEVSPASEDRGVSKGIRSSADPAYACYDPSATPPSWPARTVDARGHRAGIGLAGAGREIRPTPAGGISPIRLAKQRDIGAEAAGGGQGRRGVRADAEACGLRRRKHHGQPALARRVLEAAPHGRCVRPRGRLDDDYERHRPLARPDAATGRGHRALNGAGIEGDLGAATAGDRSEDLHVAPRIGNQGCEGRILVGVASPGDAHQGDAHRFREGRIRVREGDGDLARANLLGRGGDADAP